MKSEAEIRKYRDELKSVLGTPKHWAVEGDPCEDLKLSYVRGAMLCVVSYLSWALGEEDEVEDKHATLTKSRP